MMKIRLKNEKGAIGTDTFIALLVIILFVGLIATLTYNIYIATTETKRRAQATSYIIEIFEYIDKQYYADITEDDLVEYINYRYNNSENASTDTNISNINIASALNVTSIENTDNTKEILNTPYKIEISIEPYNKQIDLVKTITVTVKYNIGNKESKLTMTKVKSKENLITPNNPEMELLQVEEGKNIYPVKYNKGTWLVTNSEDDTTWYNYENGYWAIVFVSKENLEEGEAIPVTAVGDFYIWIPRYAYSSSDMKFLYKDTDKYVNEAGNLESIDTDTYTIKNGGWIETFYMQPEELQEEYSILEGFINRVNV